MILKTSLVAQTVKHLPTMRETQVQSLDQEDLLEKEMATHSSILAWKIPWTEKPGGLQVQGVAKSRTRLSDFTSLHFSELYTNGVLQLQQTALGGTPVHHVVVETTLFV